MIHACKGKVPDCRGLQAAVEGLRGEGPLVSVQLDVRNDVPVQLHQIPIPVAQLTPDPPIKPEGPMTGPLTKSLSRSVFSPDRRRGSVGTPPSDSVLPFKGMGLLARLGFCRRPFSDDEGETNVAPQPVIRPIQPDPHVRIRIKVRSLAHVSHACMTQEMFMITFACMRTFSHGLLIRIATCMNGWKSIAYHGS